MLVGVRLFARIRDRLRARTRSHSLPPYRPAVWFGERLRRWGLCVGRTDDDHPAAQPVATSGGARAVRIRAFQRHSRPSRRRPRRRSPHAGRTETPRSRGSLHACRFQVQADSRSRSRSTRGRVDGAVAVSRAIPRGAGRRRSSSALGTHRPVQHTERSIGGAPCGGVPRGGAAEPRRDPRPPSIARARSRVERPARFQKVLKSLFPDGPVTRGFVFSSADLWPTIREAMLE